MTMPEQPVEVLERRRGGVLFPTLLVLAVLAIAFTGFASYYADFLWFRSVQFTGVYGTLLKTRIGLFFFFGLLMAALVLANALLAYRFRPVFRGLTPEQQSLERYRTAAEPLRKPLIAAAAIVLTIIGGTSAVSQWREYLLWRNAVPYFCPSS